MLLFETLVRGGGGGGGGMGGEGGVFKGVVVDVVGVVVGYVGMLIGSKIVNGCGAMLGLVVEKGNYVSSKVTCLLVVEIV
ncbi:hypothetical protein Tco_0457744 [Tanacetum coccineum]